VVKYTKSQSTLISDLEGDLDVESDCEGDLTGTGSETPKVKEERESEINRAVLITGSFSAYVQFFALH